MGRGRARQATASSLQADLFSVDPAGQLAQRLDGQRWPAPARFPVNRAGAKVRHQVWADLLASPRPLLVAGYASIAQLVELAAAWDGCHADGQVRVVLGAEPFPTSRRRFASAAVEFSEQAKAYWLEERGISLQLSAKVLQAIDAIDRQRLACRFVHGATTLHAKVYVGAGAATVGSSNFTDAGLSAQIEANARFERAGEAARYRELVRIAENLWDIGEDWTAELRALLEALLQLVGWHEALARACAELLEGDWAARYLGALTGAETAGLWPSQRAGIAQALWIADQVGSVLVADATGSGKTRMGAQLVRAVRDRLWSTGRARRDLTVLVCPPSVEPTWQREAISCGLSLATVSHGLLSRASAFGPRPEELAVRRAQILAVDEAHNFLNREAIRTRHVRDSQADHVALFTATPINRGAGDLLQLVGLLGADNFDDATLRVLDRLERRRAGEDWLTPDDVDRLRREIQRFTVRRTKAQLNDLVDRDPEAYRHPDTGRVCRYPRHDARTYATGERPDDEAVADTMRAVAAELVGVCQLERVVAVPVGLRAEYTDERWLGLRVTSARGLSIHHVMGALRSSRAALVEHLAGTDEACRRYDLDPRFKAAGSGDMIAKCRRLADEGPPDTTALGCDVPSWLVDPDEWRAVCDAERQRFERLLDSVERLSDARELTKARLVGQLSERHQRVLAFDHHLITLAAIQRELAGADVPVVVATGATPANRQRVERLFARTSTTRAIALCSDAMNEGLNLQGASAVVHLDLPTTLRVAEQRIGRVDRMDSPHDVIEAWWPNDGPAFATRANELLAQRASEVTALLGANLPVPVLGAADPDAVVDVHTHIAAAESGQAELWDGIRDALDPVRRLVQGADALVPAAVYDEQRRSGRLAATRLAVVDADEPWVFFAVAGTGHGAPRWVAIDGGQPVVELDAIGDVLRRRLAADPPTRALDEQAARQLDRFLAIAVALEHALLPRRMQRALAQLRAATAAWATSAQRAGDEATARGWRRLGELAEPAAPDRVQPDPYLVAERWLELVAPLLDAHRARRRHHRYVVLADIDAELRSAPLPLDVVERALSNLPALEPLAERVSACILGLAAPSAAMPIPRTTHLGSR